MGCRQWKIPMLMDHGHCYDDLAYGSHTTCYHHRQRRSYGHQHQDLEFSWNFGRSNWHRGMVSAEEFKCFQGSREGKSEVKTAYLAAPKAGSIIQGAKLDSFGSSRLQLVGCTLVISSFFGSMWVTICEPCSVILSSTCDYKRVGGQKK